MKLFKLLGALALLTLSTVSFAQTAGTVSFAVTPTTGTGTVSPRATWSTTPAASSCRGSWTTNTLNASGTSVALPPITASTDYTLACTWPGSAGTATVSWTPPTTNTDGSALTDLAGFKVLVGLSATSFTQQVTLTNPTATSTTVGSLTPGAAYFFTVRAVNANGTESDNSNVTQKVIVGGTPPTASKTASVVIIINKVPAPPTNTTVIETTAYNVVPDLQHFAFVRGSRAGKVNRGAACDESRQTADGYTVISRNSQVTPRPASGTVLVARCG